MSSIDDKSGNIIAISAAMIGVLVFSICVRFYTRTLINRWVGVDDTLILIAGLFALVEGITPVLATKYGLGKHFTEQKPEWVKNYTKLTLASSISYSASAMFIKLSLLTFYLRLLPNEPVFKAIVYSMVFVSIAFGVGSILSAGLQCLPTAMLWDVTVKGKCINVNAFYYANASLNIITDIIIYILPLPTLWKLNLPMIQRVGLCAVLGLGGLVVVASIVRISSLRDLLRSPDITWNVVSPLNWSTIELDIAIFATCVPAFKAFIRHYLPTLLGTSRNGTYGPSTSHNKNTLRSRQHSIPLGSVVHSERDIPSHFHGHKHANNTTTTITGMDKRTFGLDYERDNESEEFVLPKQGITQHTSVRVEYDDDAVKGRSGASSNGNSSEIKRTEDQV